MAPDDPPPPSELPPPPPAVAAASPEPPAAPESSGNAGDGVAAALPDVLPVLPLREMVLFPDMLMPMTISEDAEAKLVDQALLQNRFAAFAPQRKPSENCLDPSVLHDHGAAGVILKMMRLPDGNMRLLVQGLRRIRIETYLQREPYLVARTAPRPDALTPGVPLDALHRSVRARFDQLLALLPQVPDEVKIAAANIAIPGRFADLVAANINLTMEERCSVLDANDVMERLRRVSVYLEREAQIVELGSKIQEDVKSKIGKGQREFFLREQLKTIRQELGEEDERVEISELGEAIGKANLPEEAAKEARREFARLQRMPAGSAEYTVSRTYLDWMVSLPWRATTEDRIDPVRARRILDADHYDLKRVKERIIEFLSVRKIHPSGRSPILCFAGPPGVGKTSLGKSIARAMGRKCERISLGGVRDEAEIRGHRRTYIGSMPGRVLQALRRCGTANPVFILDEIDKLASDYRGDPAAALLEVLDPEQNHAFRDHYLDVAFDLSRVIFIATANQLDPVPPALLDRLEVLRLPGYSTEEKLQIARRHLLPQVFSDHGMKARQVTVNNAALLRLIQDYTREAGVRNFARELASLVRKAAVRLAGGEKGPFAIKPGDLREALGPARFFGSTASPAGERPGVALGLSWSPSGGDVLFVEAARMAGKKNLQLTGRLGDIIKESAAAALSWLRMRADRLGLAPDFYENLDLHIHFPEGATPKDGPSAGVALAAALTSLLVNAPVRPRLAMTGEITLRGKVLPVGGIKEKMLAARRSGVRDVILPADNEHDLDELPPEVARDLRFHFVRDVAEALAVAFPGRFPGLAAGIASAPSGTKKVGRPAPKTKAKPGTGPRGHSAAKTHRPLAPRKHVRRRKMDF